MIKCLKCKAEIDDGKKEIIEDYCKTCMDEKIKEINSLSRKKSWRHKPAKHNDF